MTFVTKCPAPYVSLFVLDAAVFRVNGDMVLGSHFDPEPGSPVSLVNLIKAALPAISLVRLHLLAVLLPKFSLGIHISGF